MDLTSERALLAYEPETGNFRWLVTRNSFAGKAKAGAIAGSPKDGYVQIICAKKQWRAHRLAWAFMTGELPIKGLEIDHINLNRSDNRWANLRLVTRSQNMMNGNIQSNNKSGHAGVSWAKQIRKWDARITVNRKPILLGKFSDIESAIAARQAAEIEHFGQYSRNS
jgi:hypothetical protein